MESGSAGPRTLPTFRCSVPWPGPQGSDSRKRAAPQSTDLRDAAAPVAAQSAASDHPAQRNCPDGLPVPNAAVPARSRPEFPLPPLAELHTGDSRTSWLPVSVALVGPAFRLVSTATAPAP